ncbi:hypothetical protein D3C75_816000 [compost metagenome]
MNTSIASVLSFAVELIPITGTSGFDDQTSPSGVTMPVRKSPDLLKNANNGVGDFKAFISTPQYNIASIRVSFVIPCNSSLP